MVKSVRLFASYLRLHALTIGQYPGSIVISLVGNLLNDATWLAFWWLFFNRFTCVAGWALRDVFILWAVNGLGFSLASGLAGNFLEVARLITTGELDYYLHAPAPPLWHLLVSRMQPDGWFEASFWLAFFVFFVSREPTLICLYILASGLVAVVFVSVGILTGSLAFVIGSAEGLAREVANVFVTLATYPTAVFRGVAKVIIFTIIPAGFISLLPVELMRTASLLTLACLGAFTLLMACMAWLAFDRGRRSYESGSTLGLRA